MKAEPASLIVSRESLKRALKLGSGSASDYYVYQELKFKLASGTITSCFALMRCSRRRLLKVLRTSMMLIQSILALGTPNATALEAAQKCWETAGDVATLVVIVGVIGEFLAEFTNVLDLKNLDLKKNDARRHRFGKFSTLILIAGLAGELLSHNRSSKLSAKINALQTEAAAMANKEAGQARKQAGEALERAAKADLARVQLEASMMWRHLSEKQKQILCSVLSPKRANQSMIISSPQDPEAWSYAAEFGDELRRCAISGGFAPAGHLGGTNWSSNVRFGVWLRYSKNPNWDISEAGRKRLALSLRKALEDAGVKIAGMSTTEDASGFIDIYVGPKFPPHADESTNISQ
jgi:hypothetical protein